MAQSQDWKRPTFRTRFKVILKSKFKASRNTRLYETDFGDYNCNLSLRTLARRLKRLQLLFLWQNKLKCKFSIKRRMKRLLVWK